MVYVDEYGFGERLVELIRPEHARIELFFLRHLGRLTSITCGLLLDQIVSELLSLINEINSKIDSFKAAVDGTYNEPFFGDAKTKNGYQKRVRAVIQNLNQQFMEKISRHGHFRHVLEGEDQRSGSKTQHIETLLKKTRGRELPSTFNPLIVKDLFQEQCGPWEDITHSHITAAWTAGICDMHWRREAKSSLCRINEAILSPITTTSPKHSKRLALITKKKPSAKLFNHILVLILFQSFNL
ncbi:hypothetical protein N7460_004340 [Penicillium canescens]|uniref:Uncharacterized protein n=1 Tax=Penicillium canescens TaxID=5083 RepID=A0AAD6IHR4_PENCN|nr:hypothetical protein N7444_012747 [Penicillium canescens]KAJ6048193.1 hypothetical protein N7460_004340 [Penicillium canescens]